MVTAKLHKRNICAVAEDRWQWKFGWWLLFKLAITYAFYFWISFVAFHTSTGLIIANSISSTASRTKNTFVCKTRNQLVVSMKIYLLTSENRSITKTPYLISRLLPRMHWASVVLLAQQTYPPSRFTQRSDELSLHKLSLLSHSSISTNDVCLQNKRKRWNEKKKLRLRYQEFGKSSNAYWK